MPPLSPCKVKAGSKIKSLASIPGRGPDDSLLVPHVSPKPSAKVTIYCVVVDCKDV